MKALLLIGGIFLTAVLVPVRWIEGLPLCIFRSMTGWECPGCGLTRAFVALFHGQWVAAVRFNALAPVIVLYLLIYAMDHVYTWRYKQRPAWFSQEGGKVITLLFAFLAIGQWIYKSGIHAYHLYFN